MIDLYFEVDQLLALKTYFASKQCSWLGTGPQALDLYAQIGWDTCLINHAGPSCFARSQDLIEYYKKGQVLEGGRSSYKVPGWSSLCRLFLLDVRMKTDCLSQMHHISLLSTRTKS